MRIEEVRAVADFRAYVLAAVGRPTGDGVATDEQCRVMVVRDFYQPLVSLFKKRASWRAVEFVPGFVVYRREGRFWQHSQVSTLFCQLLFQLADQKIDGFLRAKGPGPAW